MVPYNKLEAMHTSTLDAGRPLFIHKKSKPIPTWKPFLEPSLALATRGTPKLTSTLTGSSLYTSPTPADTEGFTKFSFRVSANGFAIMQKDRSRVNE